MADGGKARLERAGKAMADGNRAWAQGRYDVAASSFRVAALLCPDQPDPHRNLGAALRKLKHVDAAIVSHRRALALSPDDAGIHTNLGNALREMGQLDEALSHLRRATGLQPDNLSMRFNLALCLRDARHMDEALALFEELAALQPDNAATAWDLALTHLYLRDYGKGWVGYESRWKLPDMPPRRIAGPRLRPGEDVAGRTILLISEQGFGDALQFARFVSRLAGRGARVILECQPELRELFAGLPGVVAVVDKHAEPPPYDAWAPMLSLAHILGVGWDDLPGPMPYLKAPRKPAQPLDRPPGTVLNVGVVWAGKTTPRDRSWPLTALMPLFADPRMVFWSLQLGPRQKDLAACGADSLIRDLSPRLTSFGETAAHLSELDLIITVDTAMAHLAGGLGRPVWVLLRHVSDWRWLNEPQDCVWYPTMRLFRQDGPTDFAGPVARMRQMLKKVADARSKPF